MCAWLGWDELDYNTHQYNQGYAYLQAFFAGNERAAAEWSSTTMYWKWWINQWDLRNARLVAKYDAAGDFDPERARQFERDYRLTHTWGNVTTYPGTQVAGLITDELKKKLKLIELN